MNTVVLTEGGPLGGHLDKILSNAKQIISGGVDVESYSKQGAAEIAKNEEKLRKAGVDTNRIREIAKRNAAGIGRMNISEATVLEEGFAERSNEILQQTFLQTFTDVYSELKGASDEEISIGLAILLGVFVAQIICMTVVMTLCTAAGMPLLVATGVSNAVVAIFIAPITEEYARWFALKNNIGVSGFTAVINVMEFIGYTLNILRAGGTLIGAIVLRTLAAMMHQFNTALQIRGYLKDTKDKKDSPGLNSFLIAVAVHAAWNFLGVVFNAPIMRLAGMREAAVDTEQACLIELSLS